MKSKKIKKIFSILCLSAVLLIILSFNTSAYAANDDYEPLKVEIPYDDICKIENEKSNSAIHLIIIPKDNAPQPYNTEKTDSNLYGKLNFTFDKTGIYVYEINADIQTENKISSQKILITFYVSNSENSEINELKLQTFTIENENGLKINQIKFNQSYNRQNSETFLTGDSGYIPQYTAITAISALCIIILLMIHKRKGREEYD